MPRNTKEQKKVEEKETKKATVSATKTSTAVKKATTKKAEAKKSTTTKKATTKTKKETTAKKVSTIKSKTTKSTSTAKKSTTKKTATKKATTTRTKKVPVEKKVDLVEYYDLPYRYNQTVVKILAQTPNTLFIYWDISDYDRENFKNQYGENFFENTRPILIVTNNTMNYRFEVEINDFANSWYLRVKDTDCNYSIELGRKPIPEPSIAEVLPQYLYIATSNSLTSPNDHILFTTDDFIFKNVKTNTYTHKSFSSLQIRKGMRKIYNIYDLYKNLYDTEEVIYDFANPSSGNPTSGNFRVGKFI